jgi:lysophospholipase L1-like esterase
VVYVDTMGLMSTDGSYDPRWRQSDGVHFNIAGTRRLADYVAAIILKEWHLDEGKTSSSPSP